MLLGFILLGLIITPTITLANIEITEIMYDLEGSDSKREWIEIYNGGNEPIDLTDWRFNDGSNHTFVGDNLVVNSNSYAVVASDAETNLSPGLVIDTVMSLNNTEDTISIIDSNGASISSVTYTSELGANGNGNSLQKIGVTWTEGIPTPNGSNVVEDEEVIEEINEEETVDEIVEEEASFATHVYSNIKAEAGGEKVGVASSLIFFEGKSFGIKNKPLLNARYLWNFGDGSFKEGKNVSHTYTYPGTYHVTLDVSSGEHSAIDTTVVEISEAKVDIVYADRGRIEISNNSSKRLDLSYWKIKYKDYYFTFPKGTYILANHTGVFPAEVTNIFVNELDNLFVLYPNGTIATQYLKNVEQVPTSVKSSQKVIEYVYVSKEIDVPEVKPIDESEAEIAPTTTLANVLSSETQNSDKGMYKWLVGLVSLISIASLVVLSLKYEEKGTASSNEPKADDFKIIN